MVERRLYEIARALGIETQRIIRKCRENGIPIRNHMHPVSPALEKLIRAWFADEPGPGEDFKSAPKEPD